MVARLRAAGAIVLAKTNVPELGAGGNTRNPVSGATGNPFDPRLTAGGSAGGSAAALAADPLPLCTGSGTGGSLRLPAALCGVVGCRPSVDVIAHPTRPLGWSGIAVLGPMARNMDDLILMLRACHGANPDDPLSAPSDPARFNRLPAKPLHDLRLGYGEDFGGAPVDPDIRATFRARIAALSPRVAECRPVDLTLGQMDRTVDILRAESFLAGFGQAIRETPEDFGPFIRRNVERGLSVTLADRAWAHGRTDPHPARLQRPDRGAGRHPAAHRAGLALPLDARPCRAHRGAEMDIRYRWLALTYRGSLTGGPSIVLPSGRDGRGLPFGLQVLGPVRGDGALLGVARTLEAAPAPARPRPDEARLAQSRVDLRSIVTHPPLHAVRLTPPISTAV